MHVAPSYRDTGFTASYSFDPLTNVQFTRDQQITTRRGIVMARLRSVQRSKEVELLRFCFKKIGLPIIGAPIGSLTSSSQKALAWLMRICPEPPVALRKPLRRCAGAGLPRRRRFLPRGQGLVLRRRRSEIEH